MFDKVIADMLTIVATNLDKLVHKYSWLHKISDTEYSIHRSHIIPLHVQGLPSHVNDIDEDIDSALDSVVIDNITITYDHLSGWFRFFID